MFTTFELSDGRDGEAMGVDPPAGVDGESMGTEGMAERTGDGTGEEDGAGVAVGTVAAQFGAVKVFVSRVTEPFLAKALPSTVDVVVAVIEVKARMFPLKVEAVPNVAELPTCQKTLHALAPLIRFTLLEVAVFKAEPT